MTEIETFMTDITIEGVLERGMHFCWIRFLEMDQNRIGISF